MGSFKRLKEDVAAESQCNPDFRKLEVDMDYLAFSLKDEDFTVVWTEGYSGSCCVCCPGEKQICCGGRVADVVAAAAAGESVKRLESWMSMDSLIMPDESRAARATAKIIETTRCDKDRARELLIVHGDEDAAIAACTSECTDVPRTFSLKRWPTISVLEDEVDNLKSLKSCQVEALFNVRRSCKKQHQEKYPALLTRCQELGYSELDLENTLAYIKERAPLIVHLDLENIVDKLASDTHYRNQFETGTSGGNMDLDLRRCWADYLFGKAYANAEDVDRPKFGVLNFTADPRGVSSCRRYGDCFLTLRSVRLRTTLSPADSGTIAESWRADAVSKLATVDYYAHVLHDYTKEELQAMMTVGTGGHHESISERLNYKEAQFHGELCLADHVASIHVHRRLRGKSELMQRLADTCGGAPLIWFDPEPTRGTAAAAPVAPRKKLKLQCHLDQAQQQCQQ